jgi:hypothetical protein
MNLSERQITTNLESAIRDPFLPVAVHHFISRKVREQKIDCVQRSISIGLQDQALLILLLLGQKSCTRGMLEDFTDTFVGFCGTLKILVGTNLLAHFLTLQTTVSAISPKERLTRS